MVLFNPSNYDRYHPDDISREIVLKTIEFFETKGLKKIKEDDQEMTWYEDWLEFVKKEKTFARLLTPQGYGPEDSRWDMWRIAGYNEVLGFYGTSYWYLWQVTILGLGPIWMGENEAVKHKAAELLQQGAVFAFGLSEKEHGADIYSTEMKLTPQPDGTYRANGSKFYIGNGNCAALVSTFGKIEGTDDYVFFVVSPEHDKYELVKNIKTSGVRQTYVAEFNLHDYPITEADILSKGRKAWDSALNTVNIGKYELGFCSIGIATHCLYEAINHASKRNLYGRYVTDFPHVKKLFTEAYARLVAMKLFALRAADYMRSASNEDRRYLLFNPMVKMKVTQQGEKVVALLHEIIAAKGFEQETYFELAIREIGMLPKLEGTEHVNMALIIKFTKNYLFSHIDFPEIGQISDAKDDDYLFQQYTGGLAKIRFPKYDTAYKGIDIPNVLIFKEQLELFRTLLMNAAPSPEQQKNIDYMLAAGELFTLIVYGQLILENAKIYDISDEIVNEIFTFFIKDFSHFALNMVLNYENSPSQEDIFRRMIKKPAINKEMFEKVWQQNVYSLQDVYLMNE